ncbi:LuxR family transcriptional regulator [Streptomyces sp. SID13031]|uniref:helix-turn-helix transcriptional regulator n=1 Tax=Streptomyces sp. SID13031 TaxID=2706046 RepID=UPI0013C549BA|nr:LuxR family transcriptional regulator [Streptomyces sp. SID13031]NEA36885.1 AAA family ATPase [Streptomyces sp. SID13031]
MDDPTVYERDAELSVLEAAVDEVRAGGSAVVVVSGDAGIGKTQLIERTRRSAAERGVRVLASRGSPLEREYPFGMVRQLFEPLLVAGEGPDDRLSDVARGALDAFRSRPDGSIPGEFSALHGMFWLTSDLSRTTPLLFLLDDLHWADEPSLRFIAYLLPRLEDLRVLLLLGMRPDEPGAATNLLDLITVDAATTILRPGPLSRVAAAALLAETFGREPDEAIVVACHEATGGNPFLLAELARSARADGLLPIVENRQEILRGGALSLSRRTSLQLSRMRPEPVRLAEAFAILGPAADLATAARLADISTNQAISGIDELESARLIRHDEQLPYGTLYEYVHPLLQTAVYEQMKPSRRAAYHAAAVRSLTEAGAAPEKIAAHLLRLPPDANAATVTALRQAAAAALARGAPEASVTYLRRALAEPPAADLRVDLLTEAGLAAARVDLPLAAEHLAAVVREQTDPVARAQVAHVLGLVYLYTDHLDEAIGLLTDAIADLPASEQDLCRTLRAVLINASLVATGVAATVTKVDDARVLPPLDSLGGKLLDGIVGGHDAYVGDPQSIDRTRRLSVDPAIRSAAGQGVMLAASPFLALIMAGAAEGMSGFTAAIAQARRGGVLSTLTTAHAYRGLGWLQQGELAEAETDIRESQRLAALTGFSLALPVINAMLADTLVEAGKIDDARALLSQLNIHDPLPTVGLYFYPLLSSARVAAAQGQHEAALQSALASGARFAEHANGDNPAVVAWRSQAALSLYALGRTAEATRLAFAEIELARRWGAPFALGRAIRVAGRIARGEAGLDLLHEAVDVLTGSTARLEHAKALVDLGAALRRGNARVEARTPLATGLELAYRCGAAPVVEFARTELRASGARPRRMMTSGAGSLTTSERRVADLAVRDLTNRQIAQELFVTIKTVEVHLSAVYRKLGITQRRQLNEHLEIQEAPA